jgi:flagellar assembly protein FliH
MKTGFQQGQKDGHEVGRRALEEVVKRLQNLVIDIEQERESLFRQREKILVDLVLLISEKLLARELSLHPEAIRQIIEEGFRQVAQQEGVRLLVSPPDYEVLRQENLESWPPGVELTADGTISPGGFRLETSLGEVDGTRQTRWNLVVQAVQQALEASYASVTKIDFERLQSSLAANHAFCLGGASSGNGRSGDYQPGARGGSGQNL